MKSLITLSLLLGVLVSGAQTPGEVLADRVAKKMKDSLSLTEAQKGQIYSINMQLYQQKQEMFSKYKAAADSLRFYVQRIENTRDTLYSSVLSAEKYQLYKRKKLNLLFDN